MKPRIGGLYRIEKDNLGAEYFGDFTDRWVWVYLCEGDIVLCLGDDLREPHAVPLNKDRTLMLWGKTTLSIETSCFFNGQIKPVTEE